MNEKKSEKWNKTDLILNAVIALCNIFFVSINLYYVNYGNSAKDFELRKSWIFICTIGVTIALYFVAEVVLAQDIEKKVKAMERVLKILFAVDFIYFLFGKCFCLSRYCECENFIAYAYLPLLFWLINVLFFLC